MLDSFVAFDVETATSNLSSICQIGIAVVCNCEITECKSWLVQPPYNIYATIQQNVHGICPEDTKDTPLFPEVWEKVRPYLENKIIVGHNVTFDMEALHDALSLYAIDSPSFDFICTLQMSRRLMSGLRSRSLDKVYEALFNKKMSKHHDACDDAVACAEIMIEHVRRHNIADIGEIEDWCGVQVFHIPAKHYNPPMKRVKNVAKIFAEGYVVSAKSIESDMSRVNVNNHFYDKKVCVTGAFSLFKRQEIFQYIADVGGKPVDSVTKTTDILLVGQQDIEIVGSDGISGKQRKALKMRAEGHPIEILSEVQFLSLAPDFVKKAET